MSQSSNARDEKSLRVDPGCRSNGVVDGKILHSRYKAFNSLTLTKTLALRDHYRPNRLMPGMPRHNASGESV